MGIGTPRLPPVVIRENKAGQEVGGHGKRTEVGGEQGMKEVHIPLSLLPTEK